MDLNEYQKLAMRTRFKDKPIEQEFLYGALGLSGELSEVMECINNNQIKDLENFREEIGDVMWYVSYLCTLNNFTLEDLLYIYTLYYGDIFKVLTISSGNICDIEKKVYFHEQKRDTNKVKICLANIFRYIKRLCKDYSVDFELALQGNIEKLKDRYPDGFSVEASLNRRR